MPELNTKFPTGFGGQSSGPVPARTILWRLTRKPRNADSKKVYFCQKQLFTILPFLLLCNSSRDSITQLCIFSDAVKNAKDAVKEFSIIPCWPFNFFSTKSGSRNRNQRNRLGLEKTEGWRNRIWSWFPAFESQESWKGKRWNLIFDNFNSTS